MEKTDTKAVEKADRKKRNAPAAQSFFTPALDKCRDVVAFVKDTKKELYNVSWPGRKEVTGTTIVVIASVFFFGFFLFVVDFLVNGGMGYILKLKLK
ncbi:MAG: preprotein translocase subunit SecE [Acidobacteriota bacterium]|jgi:preprotein translocase SecE subunit|nr:preprotein translocase subunit SecE [Acidobacteriota bacterium]